MINRTEKKVFLYGLKAKGVKVCKAKTKPLGYVVAGLGYVALVVAVIPNGLGFVFYPLGFGLLNLVGIRFSVRDVYNKFECTRRFL